MTSVATSVGTSGGVVFSSLVPGKVCPSGDSFCSNALSNGGGGVSLLSIYINILICRLSLFWGVALNEELMSKRQGTRFNNGNLASLLFIIDEHFGSVLFNFRFLTLTCL